MNLNFNSRISFFLTIFLFTLFTLPTTTTGNENTANCHCFRNRVFDPANRFIADDYILTTTFNSLLASEFNISKRQIIMMKMKDGVANTDLITALYIAKETDSEVKQLLQMRKTISWQEIVRPLLENPTLPKTKDTLSFIQKSNSDDQIGNLITQLLIVSRFSSSPGELDGLIKRGLTLKQIVLAYTLGKYATIPVDKIADQYLAQKRSWSEIAHNLGLQPADAGKLLEKRESTN